MKIKIVIFMAVALFTGRLAAEDNWKKIGEKSVSFKQEKDEILVTGADRYSALKFKVTEAAIDLIDFDVFYDGDEKPQNIKINFPVKVGGESRIIDIKNSEKGIKKIVLVYKTLPNSRDEKAQVEIWGLKMADKDKDHKDHKDHKH